MHILDYHYWPLVPLFFLLLVVVGGLVVAALQIGVISYAYEKMGVSEGWVTALLLGSLLGSYINIPIAELGVAESQQRGVFDLRRAARAAGHSQLAGNGLGVNVGGAIIPTALSIYLLAKNQIVRPRD